MPAPLTVWTADEIRFMHKLYVEQGLPPAEVHRLIIAEFKRGQTLPQLRKCIETRKWTRRRQMLQHRADVAIGKSNGKIVEKTKKHYEQVMGEFVEKTTSGARKALQFVENAGSARELNTAASAAKTLITTMRLCAGLDDRGPKPGSQVFNIHFAAGQAPQMKPAEPVAVEVESVEAPAEAIEA